MPLEEFKNVQKEIQRVFYGDSSIPELLFIALLAKGHVLLEGVPGIAKTTLAKSFSTTLGCNMKRIQFTPDLMPQDISGSYIFDMKTQSFKLVKGPIFSNIILCDEINRAPAKTQSALLEAMQETQVTIEGQTEQLEEPFMVIATQNPIEHQGVYQLPEAQLDRFMFKIILDYPSAQMESKMLQAHGAVAQVAHEVLSKDAIEAMRKQVEQIHVKNELYTYITAIIRATRSDNRILLGASPRAGLLLLQAAKAKAFISGRDFVTPDDLKTLATFALTHRLVFSEGESTAAYEHKEALRISKSIFEQIPFSTSALGA
jgi:MoxR-like ATPase